MPSNFQSIFTVSLTLYFRYIQAYSNLIEPCFILLRHIKNPGIFRDIQLQAYSKHYAQHLGRFKHVQISGLFRHVMFQAYSAIFTALDILRHICPHQGIFQQIQAYSESWHSQAYSYILKHIQNPGFIHAYSEPQTYLAKFRHVIQKLLESKLCLF